MHKYSINRHATNDTNIFVFLPQQLGEITIKNQQTLMWNLIHNAENHATSMRTLRRPELSKYGLRNLSPSTYCLKKNAHFNNILRICCTLWKQLILQPRSTWDSVRPTSGGLLVHHVLRPLQYHVRSAANRTPLTPSNIRTSRSLKGYRRCITIQPWGLIFISQNILHT